MISPWDSDQTSPDLAPDSPQQEFEKTDAGYVIPLAYAPAEGCGKQFFIDGHQVALFRRGDDFFAVDDRCPHQAASLAAGDVNGTTVACPLHGWVFDFQTGLAQGRNGYQLQSFSLERSGDELRLQLPEPVAPVWDGVYRYLIRYGVLGWVAEFGSIQPVPCQFKERVVVRTERGLEVGEVLIPATAGPVSASHAKPQGEVERCLNPGETVPEIPAELLDACDAALAAHSLSLDLVDSEILFDGSTCIVYFLGEQSPQLPVIEARLAARLGIVVRFHPVIEPPPSSGGGCGAGGCGCKS